jgi:hypothetical protein
MNEDELIKEIAAKGHTLKLDSAGNPDDCAFDFEGSDDDIPHNGFACTKCSDTWCVHCSHVASDIGQCRGK